MARRIVKPTRGKLGPWTFALKQETSTFGRVLVVGNRDAIRIRVMSVSPESEHITDAILDLGNRWDVLD